MLACPALLNSTAAFERVPFGSEQKASAPATLTEEPCYRVNLLARRARLRWRKKTSPPVYAH